MLSADPQMVWPGASIFRVGPVRFEPLGSDLFPQNLSANLAANFYGCPPSLPITLSTGPAAVVGRDCPPRDSD